MATEAQFQTRFLKWVARNWDTNNSYAWELKVSKTNSIPFDAVKLHQIHGLKMKRIIHKIPDTGYEQKFYDCYQIVRKEAYVCIMFNCNKRGQHKFYMIPVDAFEAESIISSRRSLTEIQACRIGDAYNLDE